MIIKNVTLNSFGKFQDKKLEFSDGVNIVIGDNEAGKTTIHTFIEGMIYGFYKANLKSKKTRDLYDKYLPWDNSIEYSGSLVLEDQQDEIRIERTFLKEHDSVNIFNNQTGENINHLYPYNSVFKMVEPGEKHLGMNQTTYSNTVSIAQMKSATSEELIAEIKENILNLSETKRVDISINNVINKVADQKNKIGTKRSKKSPYGRMVEEIEITEERLENLKKIWEDLNNFQNKEKELKKKVTGLEAEKDLTELKMKTLKKQELSAKYEQVSTLDAEIKELENRIKDLEKYKDISKDKVREALDNYKEQELLAESMERVENNLDEIRGKIEKVNQSMSEIESKSYDIKDLETLSHDVYKYDGFESSKSYIKQGYSEEDLNDKQNYLSKTLSSYKKNKLYLIASCMLVAVFLGMVIVLNFGTNLGISKEGTSLLQSNSLLIIGLLVIFSIGMVSLLIVMILKSKLVKEINRDIDEIKSNKNIVSMRLAETNEKQKGILKKYDLQTYSQLKELLTESTEKKKENDSFTVNKSTFQFELKDLEERFESEVNLLEELSLKIKNIGKNTEEIENLYQVSSGEELKKALDKSYDYNQLKQEMDNKKHLRDQVTNGKKLEDFLVTDEVSPEEITHTYEELEEILKVHNEQIVEVNKDLVKISSEIVAKENAHQHKLMLEEELSNYRRKLEKYDQKLESLTLIEEAIENISGKIQNNFAPQLNKELSKVISVATDYKYTEVKVNPDMEISIIDNDINKLVNVESLSAGTVDLMYFALRIALADIITQNRKVPILLDDSFVQYDATRFKNIIKVLQKFDRQIILFTCHKREKKISNRIFDQVNILRI